MCFAGRSSSGENESHVTDLEMERRAIQIVKALVREEIRSRYQNSNDMLHRLFVCISGMLLLGFATRFGTKVICKGF